MTPQYNVSVILTFLGVFLSAGLQVVTAISIGMDLASSKPRNVFLECLKAYMPLDWLSSATLLRERFYHCNGNMSSVKYMTFSDLI